jgi:hypothetical protein
MHNMSIDHIDVDGAIRETADAVPDSSRAGFFKKVALGAGGMIGGGATLAAFTAVASAAPLASSDIDILNFALTLEFLERDFYKEALSKAGLTGDVKTFAETAYAHEAGHVKAIQAVLGSKAIKEPTFNFQGTTSAKASFMATSKVLENTGVAAYKGQAPLVKSAAVLADAVAIHAVEADHAAWISLLLGETPFPTGAFDVPMTKAQVLAAVAKTKFIVSS